MYIGRGPIGYQVLLYYIPPLQTRASSPRSGGSDVATNTQPYYCSEPPGALSLGKKPCLVAGKEPEVFVFVFGNADTSVRAHSAGAGARFSEAG